MRIAKELRPLAKHIEEVIDIFYELNPSPSKKAVNGLKETVTQIIKDYHKW